MVWHLQDLQEQIDAEKIEAPQLLPGIDIEEQVEEKRKSRRLYNPSGSGTRNELGDIDPLDKFQTHQKNAQQMLFREREVDNLMNMIYLIDIMKLNPYYLGSNLCYRLLLLLICHCTSLHKILRLPLTLFLYVCLHHMTSNMILCSIDSIDNQLC